MKITELLLDELDREAVGIRKTLERVPEGRNDWKPHEKSMLLGYLATMKVRANHQQRGCSPIVIPKTIFPCGSDR
jgi:hypothetical protein